MSTPTPRTDEAYAKWQEGWDRTPFGPDLARTLERELATERARLDHLLQWDVTFHSREDIDEDMNFTHHERREIKTDHPQTPSSRDVGI